MTQPSRPGDLVALDEQECARRLRSAPWVRIGFGVDDVPSILPINVVLHDDAIFFRTATGSKLASAAAAGAVVIEADGGDEATRVGWSVVAHGHASIVTDAQLAEQLYALPFEPWALPNDNHFWIRVEIEELTGRRIVRP